MSDTDSWWLYCWQQQAKPAGTETDAETECICARLLNGSAD